MRKAFRHTGVLMMLGVVALGLVGAAYTLWYEKLTLEANITTGTFDIDWSCHDLSGSTPGANIADCSNAKKEVVSLNLGQTWLDAQGAATATGQTLARVQSKMPKCEAVRTQDADGNTANGNTETLSVTLHNLYPYAGCEFWLDINNNGTVPAHVKAMLSSRTKEADGSACDDTDPNPCLPLLDLSAIKVIPLSAGCAGLIALSDGPTSGDWTQINAGANALQLHGGEELECRFIVYLDQQDVEGQGIHLTLDLFWFQWNEDPAAPPA